MEILNINAIYVIIGFCYVVLSLGLITFYIVNDDFPRNGLEFAIATKSGLWAIAYLIGSLVLGIIGAIVGSIVLLGMVIIVPVYHLLAVATDRLLKA